MVYFKENYNFTRLRGGGGGGGPTFSRLGVQMLFLETHRTFDFPGGGPKPSIPPLDPHMWPFNYS